MSIGKIDRMPLREIWKHEAYDFTTWLENNIDVLSEELNIILSNPESEQNAGDFSVDILAEDENSNLVVIENQLNKSDHDHLGKLLTYLTAFEAKVGIWIVSEARPEHISTITWLNESAAADFYLFKIEAIKIGDSEPAALFTLIVGPSEETREVGVKKKQLAERHKSRKKFWKILLERAKEKTKLHSSISPTIYNWIGSGAGISGLSYNYSITRHSAKVELYIDRGKDSKEENQKIFEDLKMNKDEIEKIFGDNLSWEKLEENRSCRISKKFKKGGYKDEDNWHEIHEELINAMINLEKALSPHIKKLNI